MRNSKSSKLNIFSRRVFILTVFNGIVLFIFACRMFFLQIIKSRDYKTLSDQNSINVIFIDPERGKILDRNSVELAISKNSYKLVLYKKKDTDINYLFDKLTQILQLNEVSKQVVLKKMQAAQYFRPTVIIDYLPWKDVCSFEEVSCELKGAYINKGLVREYIFNDMFVHVLGYMGVPNDFEIEAYNLSRHKDFKVGKDGIEKTYEKNLIGEFGIKKVEVNAYRAVVQELSEQESKHGSELKLTIDKNLQEYVAETIKNEWATVVVMDITNGDVLSMVSTPGFDPNMFSRGISENEWSEINTHKSLPLTNKSIAKLYPPGSTFKIAVALAILHKGLDPQQKIYCDGAVTINGHTYKCWKKGGHGHVNLHEAIRGSCNCYFYLMGLKAGIDSIHYIADLLGLGNKTGITLPGELSGVNPDQIWKKKTRKEEWFIYDTVNACVGQGYVLVTPLQLSTMIARVASGRKVLPRLVTDIGKKEIPPSDLKDLGIDNEHLKFIRNGLENVINNPKGTGFNNRILAPEYMLAGKTGTAQVISKDTAENSGMIPKHLRSHSIFTGFAPVHNPEYSCAIIVDHGGWGSVKAAPMARDIMTKVQML
jgi:penicillin-binding protein 2